MPTRPARRQQPLREVRIEKRELAPLVDEQRLGGEDRLRAGGQQCGEAVDEGPVGRVERPRDQSTEERSDLGAGDEVAPSTRAAGGVEAHPGVVERELHVLVEVHFATSSFDLVHHPRHGGIVAG